MPEGKIRPCQEKGSLEASTGSADGFMVLPTAKPITMITAASINTV